MAYVTASKAASLAGVEVAYITAELIEWVDAWIDTYFGRDFESHEISTNDPEIHDIIDYDTQSTIRLTAKNFPIQTVTRLRDNINSTSPATINALNYRIDKEAGIVILYYNNTSAASGITQIASFTTGIAAVDLCYTYGFATVPNEVEALANYIAAKIAHANYVQAQLTPGEVSEVQIGNYSETTSYDMTFRKVYDKYREEIYIMLKALHKYRKMA